MSIISDRFVDGDEAGANLRRELAHVHRDDVDQPDLLGLQLGELLRPVPAGEDAGVDDGVERLDLAAHDGFGAGEIRDGADFDAVRGQRVARSVGRVDLDAQGQEIAGKWADALAVGHREQGSHQVDLPAERPALLEWAEYNARSWHTP